MCHFLKLIVSLKNVAHIFVQMDFLIIPAFRQGGPPQCDSPGSPSMGQT